MRIRTLGRHGRDGIRSLFRNGWMTFASVSAVAVTMLILGAGIILSLNAQAILGNVESQVQINAYVAMSVKSTALPALQKEVRQQPGVAGVQFVSKAEALQKMKKLLQSNADLMNGLGNPLPDKFVVRALNPHDTAKVATEIARIPGIRRVQYGRSFIGKLFAVVTVVRDAAIALIVGLLLLGMFLISNTIKIAIFTRRREIEIMKLVGATDGFIRGPFFIEGTLMGILGALVPSLLLYAAYRDIFKQVALFPPFSLLPPAYVFVRVDFVLFACGIFIGIWGSLVSVRKFLRV